jgi:hypothetical protein
MSETDEALVICLNSLWKIKEWNMHWWAIVVDEASLCRLHFTTNTMSDKRFEIYQLLWQFLSSARLAVVAQAELYEKDVEFYANAMAIDPTGRDRLMAIKIDKPESIHPIGYTTRFLYLFQTLVKCYVKSLAKLKDGRSALDNIQSSVPWHPDTIGHCDVELVYKELKDGKLDTLKVPKVRQLTSEELERLYGNNDNALSLGSTLSTELFSEHQRDITMFDDDDYTVKVTCTMPAVCFCASKKTAQACCILLQKVATIYGADPTRIKVLDADTKHCKGWHSRFSYDPNNYAHHCDVLFATSVIIAGFSIDTHFVHFYTILFNNILMHIEEQQLIGCLH